MCYNGRPGAHVRAEISIISCPGQFVKQNLAKNYTNYFSQNCTICLLKSTSGYGIISVSRGDSNREATRSASVVMKSGGRKKNIKNPLTNPKACDIIKAQRERTDPSKPPLIKKVQKLLKKVLDKQHKMCYNKFRGKGNNPSQIKNILS